MVVVVVMVVGFKQRWFFEKRRFLLMKKLGVRICNPEREREEDREKRWE